MEIEMQNLLETDLPAMCLEFDNEDDIAFTVLVTLAASDTVISESYLSKIVGGCIIDSDTFSETMWTNVAIFFGMGLLPLYCDCIPNTDQCMVSDILKKDTYIMGQMLEFKESPQFLYARTKIENLRMEMMY